MLNIFWILLPFSVDVAWPKSYRYLLKVSSDQKHEPCHHQEQGNLFFTKCQNQWFLAIAQSARSVAWRRLTQAERVNDNKVILKNWTFSEGLIENWFSLELSQLLNWITIFQLTLGFTDTFLLFVLVFPSQLDRIGQMSQALLDFATPGLTQLTIPFRSQNTSDIMWEQTLKTSCSNHKISR